MIRFTTYFLLILLINCKGIYKDPNTTKYTLNYDGLEREYALHLPSGYDENENYPLVICLHGGKGKIERYAKKIGWFDKSDQNQFVAIFPQGENKYWNDSRGTTKSSEENIDDIGFISALIDESISKHNINPNQVFVTGVSNGGFMTYAVGCELSEKVTAIAPVVATLPENQECSEVKHMPILFILGTKDEYIPYEGGEMDKGAGGKILSADDTFTKWAEINGCSNEIESIDIEDKYDDKTTVSVITAQSCDSNTTVIQYKVIGGGHEWQGAKSITGGSGDGNKTEEINATDIIWKFFQGYL